MFSTSRRSPVVSAASLVSLDSVDKPASSAAPGCDRLRGHPQQQRQGSGCQACLGQSKAFRECHGGHRHQGDIGVYLDAIGTVTPVYTSSITAQASGVLTAVHYSEGQLVKKGMR
jgi:hypothetical protein